MYIPPLKFDSSPHERSLMHIIHILFGSPNRWVPAPEYGLHDFDPLELVDENDTPRSTAPLLGRKLHNPSCQLRWTTRASKVSSS